MPETRLCARSGIPASGTGDHDPMAKSAPPPQKPRPARPLPPRAPKPKGPSARARISAIARDGSRSADYLLLKDETRVGTAVGGDQVKHDEDPFRAAHPPRLPFQ